MKKTLLISLMAFALAGCTTQEPAAVDVQPKTDTTDQTDISIPDVTTEAETTTTEKTPESEAPMTTYDSTAYSLDYPSSLLPEEITNSSSREVNFKDSDGKIVMLITERKGEIKDGTYLDSTDSGKTITFQDGAGKLGVNEKGWSDGPGEGPLSGVPFITYSFYDGENKMTTYNITFYGLTEESELSKKVVTSFKLKKV